MAKDVLQEDVAHGQLTRLILHHGQPVYFEVEDQALQVRADVAKTLAFSTQGPLQAVPILSLEPERFRRRRFIKRLDPVLDRTYPELRLVHRRGKTSVSLEVDKDLKEGSEVVVSRWTKRIHGVDHYEVRPASIESPANAYDQEDVPRFLFIGASVMTLGILILLCRQLPDFLVRSLLWLRFVGRYHVKVIGINNLPADGPVILATNCGNLQACLNVLSATDRFTRFILVESAMEPEPTPLLRFLARARTDRPAP